MDLATLLGMVGALGVVMAAIITGGSPVIFINVPSVLIVLAGTMLVVMIKFDLGHFLGAFKVALGAFSKKLENPEDIVQKIIELATIARKDGLLALENVEIENEFLQHGVQMVSDGHAPDVVNTLLTKDLQQTIDRHQWSAKVFTATGDVAPAMGMIGTLIGLVQMLSTMNDPKTIGPAMAIALLTTLYGAILANMVAFPIADKLNLRKVEEGRIKAICIDGLLAIQDGQNPRVIESMLKTYLAPAKREGDEKSAA
ncbi:MAG: flagellar motor protein PomA [Pseudohaliea sp.]